MDYESNYLKYKEKVSYLELLLKLNDEKFKPLENFKQVKKVKSHHSGWKIKKYAKYKIVD
jgi:hypothetical protein